MHKKKKKTVALQPNGLKVGIALRVTTSEYIFIWFSSLFRDRGWRRAVGPSFICQDTT